MNKTHVLIASAFALGMVTAFGTFASDSLHGKASLAKQWGTNGKEYSSCEILPSVKNAKQHKCVVSKGSVVGDWNYQVTYKTAKMEAGNYGVALQYHNEPAAKHGPPAPGYRYKVAVKVNGSEIKQLELPSTANGKVLKYTIQLDLKPGVNTIAFVWSNDYYKGKADPNLAIDALNLAQPSFPAPVFPSRTPAAAPKTTMTQIHAGKSLSVSDNGHTITLACYKTLPKSPVLTQVPLRIGDKRAYGTKVYQCVS